MKLFIIIALMIPIISIICKAFFHLGWEKGYKEGSEHVLFHFRMM